MNRQMRRETANAKRMNMKPRRSWSAINRPLPHEINMVFAPIDTFLRKLATGFIECADNGAPFFDDVEGHAYEATPAVRGFVSAFNRILDHYNIEIDTTPIIRLCNKLDAGMPITEGSVQHCQAIIDRCRAAYRNMDVHQVKSLVNTELIDLEFQRLKTKEATQ